MIKMVLELKMIKMVLAGLGGAGDRALNPGAEPQLHYIKVKESKELFKLERQTTMVQHRLHTCGVLLKARHRRCPVPRHQ